MMLNLLVIRSAIPEELAKFYAHFGYDFHYHRHGNGPWHYAATLAGLTLEIYPLRPSNLNLTSIYDWDLWWLTWMDYWKAWEQKFCHYLKTRNGVGGQSSLIRRDGG